MNNILFIDKREPIKKIYQFKMLDRSYDYANQLRYKILFSLIERGDYIYNNVMIHRKTIYDFDSSCMRDHMQQEMYDLHLWVAADPDNIAQLIIIGESNTVNEYSGWSNRERLGEVASLEAQFGIPITFVNNEGDFNIKCHALFRKFDPEFMRIIKPFDVFRYKSQEMRSLSFEEKFFKLFPDINKVRSRILGEIPGINIRVFVDDKPLNYDHLDNLEGIGPKTIGKIFNTLGLNGHNGNTRPENKEYPKKKAREQSQLKNT